MLPIIEILFRVPYTHYFNDKNSLGELKRVSPSTVIVQTGPRRVEAQESRKNSYSTRANTQAKLSVSSGFREKNDAFKVRFFNSLIRI